MTSGLPVALRMHTAGVSAHIAGHASIDPAMPKIIRKTGLLGPLAQVLRMLASFQPNRIPKVATTRDDIGIDLPRWSGSHNERLPA
jgi:hypothetical protein